MLPVTMSERRSLERDGEAAVDEADPDLNGPGSAARAALPRTGWVYSVPNRVVRLPSWDPVPVAAGPCAWESGDRASPCTGAARQQDPVHPTHRARLSAHPPCGWPAPRVLGLRGPRTRGVCASAGTATQDKSVGCTLDSPSVKEKGAVVSPSRLPSAAAELQKPVVEAEGWGLRPAAAAARGWVGAAQCTF